MKRIIIIFISIFILSGVLIGQAKASELKGFWREGQTFLTWQELKDVFKEQYNIYISDNKITADNYKNAKLLGTIDEGSSFNRMVLMKAKQETFDPRMKITDVTGAMPRYCIEDNTDNDPEKILSSDTGLFVNTTHNNGRYYYAVIPVINNEEQSALIIALDAPIEEKVMLPGAVIQWMHPGKKGAVYTHWMDFSKWDPDPNIEGWNGQSFYAYNFGLAVPEKYNKEDAPLPIHYYGHGMGGTYRSSVSAPYIRALWMWHGDPSGSWFFGVKNRTGNQVINYVEQRIRWSYEWVKAERPNQFFKVDPKKVYGHGHSMGGTMMTALSLRMGDIFSQAISSCGATIHKRNAVWVGQASNLWGPVSKNLTTIDGTGVWDHQDYAKWSLANIEKDSAYLVLTNGKKDESVTFEPVPDFIDAMQKSKRPFAAFWGQWDHTWNPGSTKNAEWSIIKLANDESLPAFSNASNNDDPKTTPSGQVNGKLEWSSSGNNFSPSSKADDLLDTEKIWAVNIRSIGGPATVDVTPRKVQIFKIEKGKTYSWVNLDFSDLNNPKKIDEGTVKADDHNLITVEKFQAGSNRYGNRLVIRQQ